jgi:hypothetical protein
MPHNGWMKQDEVEKLIRNREPDESYRALARAVKAAGRTCSERQALSWARDHRMFTVEEIEADEVPGLAALYRLEQVHRDPSGFNSALDKLLSVKELEDSARFECTGEDVLADLLPLAEGLLDPSMEA